MDGDCDFGVLKSASLVDALGGSLRSGHRGRIDAPRRSFNLGFRVARTVAEDETEFDPTGTGTPN